MTRPKKKELLERYGDWQAPALEKHKAELMATGIDSFSRGAKPLSKRQRDRRRAVKLRGRIESIPSLVPKRGLADVVATMDENIRWSLRRSIPVLQNFLVRLEKELKNRKS